MLEQIASAFERQDYKTAANLIKKLLKQEPQNLWGRLYVGRLYEETGKFELAEDVYRQLLRQPTLNTRIATQARTGLQRLENRIKQQRETAIAQAKAIPDNNKPGLLILEPVSGEMRTKIVQNFARLMNIDAYTAQRQLPARFWRLHRLGSIGELQVYAQELQDVGIACFWVPLADIARIRVFQVQYFSALSPQPTVICQDEANQVGTLTFNWSDVAQRVEGRLPIFESVIDLDFRGRQERKEKTQDYIQIHDLHLPSRNCILRLCESSYQYQEGITALATSQALNQQSNRLNWNHLLQQLNQPLAQTPTWSDFTVFGEMVLEQSKTVVDTTHFLGGFDSHIRLSRRAETDWDPAFQLYSGLVFLRNQSLQTPA
ncbi:tetratricopeptide repeat protein [Desertifilum sp. FACHB-1129]|uniref:Cyclic nucleotide-binding protein n=2 Tax=Desertifilum tharense IPPAS B-1220 TaxID=1781255 RepID=A0A1E5QNK4_9CYAN|nr:MULTISPECIES: tetratricopeptide repeat protein [Desertifilum]MCD8489576.1 tetratricopeptide repeat protein [Desertifilum sp.]MDA0212230.1 tetratricopeptide repeat protein [Cyanobacteria bacterium FC1]MDK3158117.1 tetratricopeptide repeat protein [Kamptonema cortianum]MBD2312809.1 tetratricopeptide repeat protein [Desertifilum sp. FACHB-1129]MBD2324173.1 tetratricopeptide repeat protein [Desertifilum sp. FACHB-866]